MAFAELPEDFAKFKIILAIPLEDIIHSQAAERLIIGHRFQILPFGQDLLAILYALIQELQFSAGPGEIGIGQANGGKHLADSPNSRALRL